MLIVDSAENVDPVSGSFSIPIPVDIIESMTVYSLPESSQYGGFTGGLTTIETKPPSGHGITSCAISSRRSGEKTIASSGLPTGRRDFCSRALSLRTK